MNNLVEQINSVKDMDDFIRFVIELALDAKDHPDEWKNKTITDYLGELSNWIDDEYMFDKEIDWDSLDYKSFAKILYMGKIYESNVEGISVYLSDSLKTFDFPAFSAGLLPYKALFSLVFALVGLKRGIFMPDSAILMKGLTV